MFAVLKHFELSVDLQHNRPDFVVSRPAQFTIEATVALHDTLTKPAYKGHTDEIPNDLNAFNQEAIVRLTASRVRS